MARRISIEILSAFVIFGLVAPAQAALSRARQAERRDRPQREIRHPKVGDKVENFSLRTVKGKKVQLADFIDRKQVFVLELGACT